MRQARIPCRPPTSPPRVTCRYSSVSCVQRVVAYHRPMSDAVLEPLFVALNTDDLDRLDGVLAEHFVFEEVAGAGEASRSALKEELSMLRSGIPDLSFRPV